jgi:ribosomal protein S18 acetylase RimI-like enzyme
VIVAVDDDGTVLGFVSGTASVRNCYRSVVSRSGFELFGTVLPSLARPVVWRRIFETLSYPLRLGKGHETADTDNSPVQAELLSIAVDRAGRGRGIGRALVTALDEFFVTRGIDDIYRVVTDASDPSSNGFYQRTGFEFTHSFTHHAHTMNMYVRRIGERMAEERA